MLVVEERTRQLTRNNLVFRYSPSKLANTGESKGMELEDNIRVLDIAILFKNRARQIGEIPVVVQLKRVEACFWFFALFFDFG